MLSKRYESTEFDSRKLLHVSTGTYGPPALTQQWHSPSRVIFKKILLFTEILFFKSEWITNIDYMRIWGIEPSLVILSQTKY